MGFLIGVIAEKVKVLRDDLQNPTVFSDKGGNAATGEVMNIRQISLVGALFFGALSCTSDSEALKKAQGKVGVDSGNKEPLEPNDQGKEFQQ